MSAADDLPEGDDASAANILSGTISFLRGGGSAGELLLGTVFGTIFSIFNGGINVFQAIIGFITRPIIAAGGATEQTIQATITEPLGIVTAGAQESATSLSQFGILAFIVGLVLLLGGFFLIIQFLEEPETSNTFVVPGFPDLPFIGVTEENEDEE